MSEAIVKSALAKQASYKTAALSTADKNTALELIAAELAKDTESIMTANALDMQNGKDAGFNASLLDRLMLNRDRIGDMALGVRQIIELRDPVGEVLSETTIPNGLTIKKVRVPLGVVGIIYEARPNVTVDAAALALKTGNAIILRGSSSAINSNKAIVESMRRALEKSSLTPEAVQLIESTDREAASEMMRLNKYIDVLIPRGSAGLIQQVLNNSTVPIIETGIGNCHIFLDENADLDMAVPLVINAKTQRPSVCNSAEKLLIHKNWPAENLKKVIDALCDAGVELRCDAEIRAVFPDDGRLLDLPELDYDTEYLDLIMGIKLVADVDEAIEHINRYGSHHTDAIISGNAENVERFLNCVDSAAVHHNASTRFTDGFMYGFGAEIGISTQKLHARGPMALPELTSYKYIVLGNGQIR